MDPLLPVTHVKTVDIRPTAKLNPKKINIKENIQRAKELTPIKEQQKEKEQKKLTS